ncbi:hypothetical protein GQ53DRAFT_669060, partial [Thozetella sp. PMI_491]
LASSAFASPTVVTSAPADKVSLSSCEVYSTSTKWNGRHACPLFCVVPDSPLCPKYPCPFIPATCPPGSTLTAAPMPVPTTILGSTTEDCSITVTADRGCAICGCLGCPRCVSRPDVATPTSA